MRPETEMEHIARDLREGNVVFPKISEAQMVPETFAEKLAVATKNMREMSPSEVALWAAGADLETAHFVAGMLAQQGYRLIRDDTPTEMDAALLHAREESSLFEVVELLAANARIYLTPDGPPELRVLTPEIGPLWDELCRGGWLEPMANGGTFKLSDAGLKAYLRSTDELGNGRLEITT